MKKFRGLKLFGLVAILAFAFVFVGINYAQGKGKGKKPPKNNTRYVWSAVILDGFGIRGVEAERYDDTWQGWVYEDSESNVNVGVEIRRAPFSGVTKHWTRFYLEIFDPVQIDLEFNPYDAWFYPDTPDAQCLYPGGYDSEDPMSMLYFMQDSFHPHSSYDKVHFRFNTDRSVDQNEIDYEQWINDYHGHLGFLSDIFGHAPMEFRPSTCEELNLFEYSHIEFGGGDYGYFERMSEDIWKVVVGMEKVPFHDYTFGQGEEDDAWATDWYQICVETQINKKKKGVTYDAIFSSQGSMDIKFEILFIRTKI
jgi:hypothetical protein